MIFVITSWFLLPLSAFIEPAIAELMFILSSFSDNIWSLKPILVVIVIVCLYCFDGGIKLPLSKSSGDTNLFNLPHVCARCMPGPRFPAVYIGDSVFCLSYEATYNPMTVVAV